MITTILDQVSKLLGQAYLVSSLTPWLMFWVANAVTVTCLVGPTAVNRWWQTEIGGSPSMLAGVTAAVVVFLAGGALLMNGAYVLFRRALEDHSDIVGLRLLLGGLAAWKRRRNRQWIQSRDDAFQAYGRATILRQNFKVRRARAETAARGRPAPEPATLEGWRRRFQTALGRRDREEAIEGLFTEMTETDSPAFTALADELQQALDALVEAAQVEQRTMTARVADRSAVVASPLEYGETLASASRYVATRYGIDSIVFWSRLQPVIPKEYLSVVQNVKVGMDMLTSLTFLALLYAGLWFLVLPGYGAAPATVLATVGSGLLAAGLFYLGAVDAARSFTETIRSSFDLYRQSLFRQLGFTLPATLKEERDAWTQISRFVLYNQAAPDLPLATGPAPVPASPAGVAAAPTAAPLAGRLSIAGRLWGFVKRLFGTPQVVAVTEAQPALIPVQSPLGPHGFWACARAAGALLRYVPDVVVIIGLVVASAWQWQRLGQLGRYEIVLGPVARESVPSGTAISPEILTFGLGALLPSDAERLVLDPKRVAGRYGQKAIAPRAFIDRGDLQEDRALRTLVLKALVIGEAVSGSRGDLWRGPAYADLSAYEPLLKAIEVIGVEPAVSNAKAAKAPWPPLRRLVLKVPIEAKLNGDGTSQTNVSFLFTVDSSALKTSPPKPLTPGSNPQGRE